jgi:FixJ family two-component response regulator
MPKYPRFAVISIVDDDDSVRTATSGLVRSLGYRAVTFSSAEEFLASEWLDKTCCLITDYLMPGLNGVELQDRLLSQGCSMPVIFITSFPEERIRLAALAAGAIGFLSKPYDEGSLIECLETAVTIADEKNRLQ